jgi:hypothetical protein
MFVKAVPETAESPERTGQEVEVSGTESGAAAESAVAGSGDIGSPGLEARQVTPVTIAEADEAEPFAVNIIFRGYCLFRYLIDGRDRDERYFQSGDTIVLDVTREVRLWISNAGSVIARVAGEEVNFGRPGEVSTRIIAWEASQDTGKEALIMRGIY